MICFIKGYTLEEVYIIKENEFYLLLVINIYENWYKTFNLNLMYHKNSFNPFFCEYTFLISIFLTLISNSIEKWIMYCATLSRSLSLGLLINLKN